MHTSSRGSLARPRLAPALAALFCVLAAVSACAQPGASSASQQAAAGGGGALTAEAADSMASRAEASRFKGVESAPITLIEVSDFQCPYCRQFFEQTYRQLDSAYIRTGKVKLAFIHYPLPNHGQAFAASKAALCAGAQGKFWELHDRLFATQREWTGQPDAPQRFARMAAAAGVNAQQYRDCVDNDRVSSIIVNDIMRASGGGVQGTPTFIFNGQKALSGALTFEQVKAELDALLAGAPRAEAPQPGAPATPPAAPPTP
jgi:protein-disulfide isomerase